MAEKSEKKRADLQALIKNAVAEKEGVISAFHGVKRPSKPPESNGLKNLLWSFGYGLCFGLGLSVALLLIAWLAVNFQTVRAALGLLGKFILLLGTLRH